MNPNMSETSAVTTGEKTLDTVEVPPIRISDRQLADVANQEDQQRGTFDSIKNSPWAIAWCLYAMWCVVLANFQSMSGSNVIGIPQFRKDFGREYNGEFVLDGTWQSAIDGVPRATFVLRKCQFVALCADFRI